MSQRDTENLDALLAAAAAGRLEALTPEQVERLAAHLDANPAAAAKVGAMRPAASPSLTTPVVLPTPRQWQEVWDRIEQATSTTRRQPESGRSATGTRAARILRIWRPIAAVAACVVLLVSWSLQSGGTPTPRLRPAVGNSVNALDAPGGAILVSDGDGWLIVMTGDEGADS